MMDGKWSCPVAALALIGALALSACGQKNSTVLGTVHLKTEPLGVGGGSIEIQAGDNKPEALGTRLDVPANVLDRTIDISLDVNEKDIISGGAKRIGPVIQISPENLALHGKVHVTLPYAGKPEQRKLQVFVVRPNEASARILKAVDLKLDAARRLISFDIDGFGQFQCAQGPDPAACSPMDCGPAPGLPNWPCEDGSTGGPTGNCVRDDNGNCGWEINWCPAVCSPMDCGPAPALAIRCPNGNPSVEVCTRLANGACGWDIHCDACVPPLTMGGGGHGGPVPPNGGPDAGSTPPCNPMTGMGCPTPPPCNPMTNPMGCPTPSPDAGTVPPCDPMTGMGCPMPPPCDPMTNPMGCPVPPPCDPMTNPMGCPTPPPVCQANCNDPSRTCPPGTECNPMSGECIPNGVQCGPNTCGAGEFCCNSSCGICAPMGAACPQISCAACGMTPMGPTMCPPGTMCGANGTCVPTGEQCGPTTCGAGEYCCNSSCGICAPMGGTCTQQACAACGMTPMGPAMCPPDQMCDPATGGCVPICGPMDCTDPRPMIPTYTCEDGSTGGPTGRCVPAVTAGGPPLSGGMGGGSSCPPGQMCPTPPPPQPQPRCEWEIRWCPRACDAMECGPQPAGGAPMCPSGMASAVCQRTPSGTCTWNITCTP